MKNFQDEPNTTDVSLYALEDPSEAGAKRFKRHTARINQQKYFLFQTNTVANENSGRKHTYVRTPSCIQPFPCFVWVVFIQKTRKLAFENILESYGMNLNLCRLRVNLRHLYSPFHLGNIMKQIILIHFIFFVFVKQQRMKNTWKFTQPREISINYREMSTH